MSASSPASKQKHSEVEDNANVSTSKRPAPEASFQRYLQHAPCVLFSTSDDQILEVDQHRLSQHSDVFAGMFNIGSRDKQTETTLVDKPIDVDFPAGVVALFFDLLGVAGDSVKSDSVKLRTPLEQTCHLYSLADMFDVDSVRSQATGRLLDFSGWAVLRQASKINNLSLARMAIARLPIAAEGANQPQETRFERVWDETRELQLSWQVGLLRQLFPTIFLSSSASTPASLIWGFHDPLDMRTIAQRFEPVRPGVDI